LQETCCIQIFQVREQQFQLGGDLRARSAQRIEPPRTLVCVELQHLVQQWTQLAPPARVDPGHAAPEGYEDSSAPERHLCRKIRAFSQSRCTVRSDMSHIAAISANEKPPKYLRSTTSANRASKSASRSTASFRRCRSVVSAICSGISVGR